MKPIIFMSLILFVIFISGCKERAIDTGLQTPDTGPQTSCTSHTDCWCRGFTGAEFIEEKNPHYCCTADENKKNPGMCPEINKCAKCIYK